MEAIDIVNEIEKNNNYIQDGLDYYMDCKVSVNNVNTRCEQISIVQCDLTKEGMSSFELLLELRRGDFITWVLLEDIESLKVNEFKKGSGVFVK